MEIANLEEKLGLARIRVAGMHPEVVGDMFYLGKICYSPFEYGVISKNKGYTANIVCVSREFLNCESDKTRVYESNYLLEEALPWSSNINVDTLLYHSYKAGYGIEFQDLFGLRVPIAGSDDTENLLIIARNLTRISEPSEEEVECYAADIDSSTSNTQEYIGYLEAKLECAECMIDQLYSIAEDHFEQCPDLKEDIHSITKHGILEAVDNAKKEEEEEEEEDGA